MAVQVRVFPASCIALLALAGGRALPGLERVRQAFELQGGLSLDSAFVRYRTLVEGGGWSVLPQGPTLARGDSGPRVTLLRRRLAREGYLDLTDAPGERFDDRVAGAVARFQGHYGLAQDSTVGPATRAALNVSASARFRQIARNLEWQRMAPPRPEPRYLRINIPAYQLEIVENGRVVLTLRVIVGRDDWPTPVTSSRISALVFRPVWRVPASIAARELIALVRRDPGYLSRNRIRTIHDPASTRYVQEPGPTNPLGGVKFPLETPYGVHLHDTPFQTLFARARRALSHGCIRVEHADRLAAYLLPAWPADSISAAMSVGRDRRVALDAPIPVFLEYRTAWVAADGLVAFREDIYRRE